MSLADSLPFVASCEVHLTSQKERLPVGCADKLVAWPSTTLECSYELILLWPHSMFEILTRVMKGKPSQLSCSYPILGSMLWLSRFWCVHQFCNHRARLREEIVTRPAVEDNDLSKDLGLATCFCWRVGIPRMTVVFVVVVSILDFTNTYPCIQICMSIIVIPTAILLL